MKIEHGYNEAELTIRIRGRAEAGTGTAEVWLLQKGLPDSVEQYRETLSYASLEEIILLRDECNEAIKAMAGL